MQVALSAMFASDFEALKAVPQTTHRTAISRVFIFVAKFDASFFAVAGLQPDLSHSQVVEELATTFTIHFFTISTLPATLLLLL